MRDEDLTKDTRVKSQSPEVKILSSLRFQFHNPHSELQTLDDDIQFIIPGFPVELTDCILKKGG